MNDLVPTVPTVSIITPSYNQGEFIEETIISVLSQMGNFFLDYIIMDGGSTDKSVEIIKKYDQLLQGNNWQVACQGISYRWASEKDKGQADAINKGFAMAQGKIRAWLNSDDTYLPGTLAKIVEYFDAHPNDVMVYGNAYYTNKDGVVTSSYPTEPFSLQRLSKNCFICQPASFMRAEALSAINQLDTNLQASMDYELWIRMGKRFAGRISFIEDYLAASRMYPENKTHAILGRVLRENLAIMQKHFGYIEGIHIASCFYDIYKNSDNLFFAENLKKLLHRFFVIQYLFNIKTFISTLKYIAASLKEYFSPAKGKKTVQ